MAKRQKQTTVSAPALDLLGRIRDGVDKGKPVVYLRGRTWRVASLMGAAQLSNIEIDFTGSTIRPLG